MGFWQKIKYRLLTKSVGLYINLISLTNKTKAGRLAYTLFSNPREGKLLQYTPFLAKAEKHVLYYKKQRIQTYHWFGTGETVLLIHGWESNSNRWQGFVQYLKKKQYNIVALDAPGQGMSSGKELNPILYSHYLEEVCKVYRPDYLVGHSLGGMTMFYFQSVFQFPTVKKVIGLGSPNKFTRITRNYKNLLSLSNSAFQYYLDVFKNQFFIDITHFSTEEFIRNIHQPVLLIHDKSDTIVPFQDAVEIAENNPDIQFVQTEHLGHSLFSQQVYKEIVAFLKSGK